MTSITKLQFPASVSLVNLARQLTIAARIRKPVVAQLSQVNTTQNRHSSTSSSISTASRSTGGGSGQKRIPATYYRGGTSRGIIFEEQHLPSNREEWGPILRGALGSPDPSGRQLNGLGTGISSLSKVCVVGRSERGDADVDYTFVQVGVREGELDYSSNCGNMSAAVGPFAVNGGLVGQLAAGDDGEVEVRIFNTNTNKVIKSRFRVTEGEAVTEGDFAIDGVAGTGAKIELAFQDPAGSRTEKLLPTGTVVDELEPGIEASCIDVANPCIFVRAKDFGVEGTILPEAGDAHPSLIARLEAVRRKGAVKMGLAQDEASVPEAAPKIIMVSPPAMYTALSGVEINSSACDLVIRSLSGKNLHRAVQMTVALATAAAAKIPGSIVEQCVSKSAVDPGGITLGHSSGKLLVTAKFDDEGKVMEATVFRTARRLFEGTLYWT